MILSATRTELVNDLPRDVKNKHDLSTMTDNEVMNAWRLYGKHSGSWAKHTDDVEIKEVKA